MSDCWLSLQYSQNFSFRLPDSPRSLSTYGIISSINTLLLINSVLRITSNASFGYFPTYALGSAIGAQLLHKMEKDLDVDELLSKGKFKQITDYLKNNVQKYGALYDYNKIVKLATGESFKPKYYINYLKKKYSKLYDIK